VLRKVPAGAAEVSDIVSEMPEAHRQVVLHPFRDDIARALEASVGGPSVASMPAPVGSPPSFAAARGAALGAIAGPELTLSTPVLERRLRVTGRRRALVHVTALAATLVLLGGALDHRRSETLARLEAEIASTQDEAAQVLELNQEAAEIADELSLLAAEMRVRANPMDVLLEVTRLLPTTAYLTQLTSTGDQWELSGLAEDAATLIPLLEASPRLADVRFRAPTTRARAQGRDVESFSVVFRHVPPT
jgi:Tfp pilus assembly protein PilN